MRRPDRRGRTARPSAVVTGCAGFIGSTLCEALVADGWRVRGADAFTDDTAATRGRRTSRPCATSRDSTWSRSTWRGARSEGCSRTGPRWCTWRAARGVRSSFGAGVPSTVRDNLVATHRLLAAARAARARRVVWASSSSVYGDVSGAPAAGSARSAGRRRPTPPPSGPARGWPSSPGTAASRRPACGCSRSTDRASADMALRRMCEALSGGPGFPLNGDGSQARDLTHVDDVVDAIRRALAAPAVAALYNVGGGRPTSLAEAIAILEVIAGARMPAWVAGPAAGDVARTAADTSRARRELGWRPRGQPGARARGAARPGCAPGAGGRGRDQSEKTNPAGRPGSAAMSGRAAAQGPLEDARALAEQARQRLGRGRLGHHPVGVVGHEADQARRAGRASPGQHGLGPAGLAHGRHARRGELGDLADRVEPRPVDVPVGAAVADREAGRRGAARPARRAPARRRGSS